MTTQGKNKQKANISDKDKEIAEPKRRLLDAEIKAEFYQEMIRIAEKQFNISINKEGER